MSYKTESGDLPTIPPLSSSNTQLGQLGDKSVVLAKKQTSEAWFIIAIIVGTFVVIGIGGFGTAGLLQSHGLISLPQGLASAIGTVGHTPHLWSLWAMAVGGGAIGIGLIAFGAIKIHQSPLRQINRAFGDNFAKIDESKDEFQSLARGNFYIWEKSDPEEKKKDGNTYFFIVLRDLSTGELKCSDRLTEKKQVILINKLEEISYSEAPEGSNTDFGDNFAEKIEESHDEVLVEVQQTPIRPFKLENFGDHFEKIPIKKDNANFTSIPKQHFNFWPIKGTNKEAWLIVLNDNDTLKCSEKLTREETILYVKELKNLKFTEFESLS